MPVEWKEVLGDFFLAVSCSQTIMYFSSSASSYDVEIDFQKTMFLTLITVPKDPSGSVIKCLPDGSTTGERKFHSRFWRGRNIAGEDYH
jgi:hypothetical protein